MSAGVDMPSYHETKLSIVIGPKAEQWSIEATNDLGDVSRRSRLVSRWVLISHRTSTPSATGDQQPPPLHIYNFLMFSQTPWMLMMLKSTCMALQLHVAYFLFAFCVARGIAKRIGQHH